MIIHPKLQLAIIVLHIRAIINIALGLGIILLSIILSGIIILAGNTQQDVGISIATVLFVLMMFGMIAVVCLAMGVFEEIVIRDLKRSKTWAWIAALIISILNIPSIYLILGILGLVGLLDKEVSAQFNSPKQVTTTLLP